MSSFTKYPSLRLLPDGESWEVVEAFEYHVGSEDSFEVIRIPKGFITDGASIPKIFWSIIGGPWGKYGYAAVVHDFLYHKKIYTRKKSDQIFLEAMEVLGVSKWKRLTMYWSVRLTAWICWNKKRKPFIPTKPIMVLIILLCLSGCSTVRIFRDEKGKVTRINSSGLQETKIKSKEEEITHETKIQWWPEDLVNVVFGAKN